MIKIPPTILLLPLFINIDWLVIYVCDSFCAETSHFLYFVQLDLLEFQRFCFQQSSCHSFNTLSFLCEYRINHYIEFITGQKLLIFFSQGFYTSKVSKQRLVFSYFWLFSQHNQPNLDWKFKNDWTNRLQKLPKCFAFLS